MTQFEVKSNVYKLNRVVVGYQKMGTGTSMTIWVQVRVPILGMDTGTNFGYQMGMGTGTGVILKWVRRYEYGYQSGY